MKTHDNTSINNSTNSNNTDSSPSSNTSSSKSTNTGVTVKSDPSIAAATPGSTQQHHNPAYPTPTRPNPQHHNLPATSPHSTINSDTSSSRSLANTPDCANNNPASSALSPQGTTTSHVSPPHLPTSHLPGSGIVPSAASHGLGSHSAFSSTASAVHPGMGPVNSGVGGGIPSAAAATADWYNIQNPATLNPPTSSLFSHPQASSMQGYYHNFQSHLVGQ